MLVECVQKVLLQGSSSMITLPRRLMFHWGLKPGDFVRILFDADTGQGTIERWGTLNVSRSPGVINEEPPKLVR